jgi:hypothetical protein
MNSSNQRPEVPMTKIRRYNQRPEVPAATLTNKPVLWDSCDSKSDKDPAFPITTTPQSRLEEIIIPPTPASNPHQSTKDAVTLYATISDMDVDVVENNYLKLLVLQELKEFWVTLFIDQSVKAE